MSTEFDADVIVVGSGVVRSNMANEREKRKVVTMLEAGQSRPAYAFGPTRFILLGDFNRPIPDSAFDQHSLIKTVSSAALYSVACAACHGIRGGRKALHPFLSLSHNSAVGARIPNYIVMAIANGVYPRGADGEVFMPAFSTSNDRVPSVLTNAQIAEVMNDVAARFGRRSANLTEEDARHIRDRDVAPFIIRYAKYGVIVGLVAVMLILSWIATRVYRSGRRRRVAKDGVFRSGKSR